MAQFNKNTAKQKPAVHPDVKLTYTVPTDHAFHLLSGVLIAQFPNNTIQLKCYTESPKIAAENVLKFNAETQQHEEIMKVEGVERFIFATLVIDASTARSIGELLMKQTDVPSISNKQA
jgi:hypothetical protein